MTAPKDEVYTGVYPKCIKDKGLCGVGGFCDVCPHVINNQDELSVEELIRWYANDDEVYGDAYPAYLEAVSRATISHLRRLQQMRAEIDAKDKILDQHIAALRSVAWAITDKACGGVDDIVAEAKRVRAELETRDAQFKAMLASYSDKCSALALDIANKTAQLEACRQELSFCIDSHGGWNKP